MDWFTSSAQCICVIDMLYAILYENVFVDQVCNVIIAFMKVNITNRQRYSISEGVITIARALIRLSVLS